MQKPFAYLPIHNIAQNSFLLRRQRSMVLFVGAVVVLVVSLTLVNIPYGTSNSAEHSSLSSSSEFSSGMPLP
jgi:hypothetical protein